MAGNLSVEVNVYRLQRNKPGMKIKPNVAQVEKIPAQEGRNSLGGEGVVSSYVDIKVAPDIGMGTDVERESTGYRGIALGTANSD